MRHVMRTNVLHNQRPMAREIVSAWIHNTVGDFASNAHARGRDDRAEVYINCERKLTMCEIRPRNIFDT